MKTNQYLADSANIGDWNGYEEQAIRVWNAHIAPLLREARETIEAKDIYDDREIDAVDNSAEWAWDEFCRRDAGDSEERAIALAEELKARLA